MKQGEIQENFIATFLTLNLGYFANSKKLFSGLSLRNPIRDGVILLFTGP